MNSFGNKFRIHIFGESHGKSIGINIDGCPPGIAISETDFENELNRRRSGAKGTTKRHEKDIPSIISGVFNGYSTGSPITIIFNNEDTQSKDYANFISHPRPGHADFVARTKYKGYNDYRGGGHFSGRMTLALVSAGVIAKKIIQSVDIKASILSLNGQQDFESALNNAIEKHDSIGGIIECRAYNMPIGLGEPFFDSVESVISHLAFSIPGVKGIEFGAGFEAANMYGSSHNDLLTDSKGSTETNHSGGINGGISNGNDLVFRIAVKPASGIGKEQESYNFETRRVEPLRIKGRHDVCIALRMPVIIEAVTAIALTDLFMSRESV